jgi:excisionase family DNA binding protein
MSTAICSDLMTREQAAVYLAVKPQTLAIWFSTGRYSLPVVRVGRAVRYRRADLDQFIADRTVTSTGQADAEG